jgi:hypothetical protein
VVVGLDEIPKSLLERLGPQKGWFILDNTGRRFPDNDALFTFVSSPDVHPLSLRQDLHLDVKKTPGVTKPEDKREVVLVQFGDYTHKFKKNYCKSYQEAVDRARDVLGLPGTWRIAVIRAEEDRILMMCVEGGNPFWFAEKASPPLETSKDKLREAARRVTPGPWTVEKAAPAPPLTIQTRAKAAGTAAVAHTPS